MKDKESAEALAVRRELAEQQERAQKALEVDLAYVFFVCPYF